MFSNPDLLYYNYTKLKRENDFAYKCSPLPLFFPLMFCLSLYYPLGFSSHAPFFRKLSLVSLDRSEGSSGLPLLPGLPSSAPITMPRLSPILALNTLGSYSLVMGLFPPTLDQELPKNPWSFGVSLDRHRGYPQ